MVKSIYKEKKKTLKKAIKSARERYVIDLNSLSRREEAAVSRRVLDNLMGELEKLEEEYLKGRY